MAKKIACFTKGCKNLMWDDSKTCWDCHKKTRNGKGNSNYKQGQTYRKCLECDKIIKGLYRKRCKECNSEFRKKLMTGLRGANAKNWKGGNAPNDLLIRRSVEYKLWRTAVYQRDKYICGWCGQKGGKLVADHIKPFSLYPALRFAIDNGRTLCYDCHKKTDTYGGKMYKYKLNN